MVIFEITLSVSLVVIRKVQFMLLKINYWSEMSTLARKILFFFGININRIVKKDILFTFLSLIQPVTTGMPLIRIGGQGDGGYLLPDDLVGVNVCFSPGVANVSDFEKELVRRGIRCYCADGSVDGSHLQNEAGIYFIQKHLGITNSQEVMTLDSWVASFEPQTQDMILQMDIECGEYGVLVDTSNETLHKFRILVIEFYNIHAWTNAQELKYVKLIFEKLLKNFDVVHVHPNNCDSNLRFASIDIPGALEITFLRKDRFLPATGRVYDFPHDLDRPNVPTRPDPRLNIFDHIRK
jgi:hypothetical protein